MRWTPDGTIRNALWIGGGQWAGKTTVAALLTERHGLVHYHYDFHDARGHEDRRIAARLRRGELTLTACEGDELPPTGQSPTAVSGDEDAAGVSRGGDQPPTDGGTSRLAPAGDNRIERDWEEIWIRRTPAEMAERIIAGFPERFAWVLEDLSGIVTRHAVVVDGWGLRPELVASVTDPGRMVVLVPTDGWRRHQAAVLPRARRVGGRVSDPELAGRNRIERDRLVASDAVRQARRLGIRVIEVDGNRPAEAVADEVDAHFARFLR